MKPLILRALLALSCSLLLVGNGSAQTVAGTVKTLLGTAYVKRGAERIPVTKEMTLYSKDMIETTPSAFVGIVLKDDTRITAGANTTLNLANYEFDPQTQKGAMKVNLTKGLIKVSSGVLGKTSRENVEFNTVVATVGIRGTTFIIDVGSDPADGASGEMLAEK